MAREEVAMEEVAMGVAMVAGATEEVEKEGVATAGAMVVVTAVAERPAPVVETTEA